MKLVQIKTSEERPERTRVALRRALEAALEGEVRFEPGDQGIYSTDASNYRHIPIGAVLPKSPEDVVAAIEVCRRFGAPIVSRGGGTSLAGQTTNDAVVFDFTKYMHAILDVDPEARTATVEPGCVLDDLRDRLAELGLTFGPDPSTHSRCTFGGMLGNNSCGTHAVLAEFYGPGPRTEDNVQELEVLTYDGARFTVGPTSPEELARIIAEGGRKGEIYAKLADLRDRYAEVIRARYPDIPRRVSGYNLLALLPENGFDVARALVGSEGTCVTILRSTVKLCPALPARVLVVVGYRSVYDAAADVPKIRGLRPVACEGIDDALVEDMKRKDMHGEHVDRLPEGGGWLLVEFGADELEEARDTAHRAAEILGRGQHVTGVHVVEDPTEQGHYWELRESGLGATAFVPGRRDAWPGWEDAAVPVDQVDAYLRAFRDLMQRYDYRAALYGHFLQGCIHCRVDFDLKSAEGVERYREFTREAAELVARFGGSLSGEHGDGEARGELLPIMYGEELVEAFREFKAIWDPEGKMNPGKVVDAPPRTDNLRLDRGDFRPWHPETHFSYPEDGGDFAHAALRCVGIGECRRKSGAGVMCPSYMVTLEEKHTTRGRARLLFEMVKDGSPIEGWKSEAVHEALDLCLACKGCKSDCPVHVDMATYKAEFLSHYYAGRLRPRVAYAVGLIDVWARLASRVPRLANFVAQSAGIGWLFKKAGQIHPARQVPEFADETFVDGFRRRDASPNPDGPVVVLWPDTFNNHFYPRTLWAAVEVLEAAGCRVTLPPMLLCCGRPLYDFGFLDRAKRYWERNLAALHRTIEAGHPLVGVEPSCVAAFRDELVNLFPDRDPARKLAENTFTLAEYLVEERPDYQPPRLERDAILQPHCHHHAIMGHEAERVVLEKLGLRTHVLEEAGCCGMAGAFGFEEDKYEVSIACGERVLFPRVREVDDDCIVIADGFSCREQVHQSTDRHPLHLAEVLQLALHQDELPSGRRAEAQLEALHRGRPAGAAASRRAAVWATGVGVVASAGLLGWWLA